MTPTLYAKNLALSVILFGSFAASAGQQVRLGDKKANSLTVITNTYQELIVSQSFSTFNAFDVATSKGLFTLLQAEGFSASEGPGLPSLPVRRELIEVPLGAKIYVDIIDEIYTDYPLGDLGLSSPILPVQPPAPKIEGYVPEFAYNQKAYSQDKFFPGKVAYADDLGMMRGSRIGRLTLSPLHYNPATQVLRVYSYLKVQVRFEGADVKATRSEQLRTYSPYFSVMNQKLLNHKPSTLPKDALTTYPVKYVIVSSPIFESALQPFVEWKTKKGFTVIEAYTDDPGVGTTTASIKSYLQNLYSQATPENPAPTFVLLVGDIAQVPSFNGTTGSHVSDKPYVEYTGDDLPEVYIGRFSAVTETHLQPQIEKTLEYEKYLMPDPSFLNEVVMIAGVDANFGPVHANGQINYGTDNYFNTAHGLTSHTYLYPQSGSSSGQIIQDVSNGAGFVNYTAHGASNGWSSPSFSTNDISGLQNAHKYPLMVGNCCLTNKFDDPTCFGEALLRASNKGALGYIGGSNVTYWDEDFYWGVGVKSIVANPAWIPGNLGAYDRTFHDHQEVFADWYTTQGQMIYAGNLAVTQGVPNNSDYYWEVYHLMGDPSLMVYFGVPQPITASFNSLIPLASPSFTLTTVPYGYAALSGGGILYGAALADSNGIAVINMANPVSMPGYISLVITAQNHQPYFDSIMVASPAGPYIMTNSYQVVDPLGNNNNLPDFGETVSLNLGLKNWGQATATNVTTTISTTDTLVTILDDSQGYGSITAGATALQNDAFQVQIAANIPDQHVVIFTLAIADDQGNNWNSSLQMTVNAPKFLVNTLTIDDLSGGNGNGRLDPGETVNLLIAVTNNGHSDAPSTMGSLSTSSNLLTINTLSYAMNTVTASGTAQAVFNATVSGAAQTGDAIPLDFAVASGAYGAQKTFTPAVGLVVEDWESGGMGQFTWQTNGDSPWFVSTQDPYEGLYCLQSGAIGNQDVSNLMITATVLMDDSISFFRKVSSEQDYDFLQFFIDGTLMDEWSGEEDWARVAYPVTAGNHTFKWVYDKDWSQANGDDCGKLDFIVFPPATGLTTAIDPDPVYTSFFSVYPNPAKGTAQVVFSLDISADVELIVMNSLGQEVVGLIKENHIPVGNHFITFDTQSLGPGLYFVRYRSGNQVNTKKLIVE